MENNNQELNKYDHLLPEDRFNLAYEEYVKTENNDYQKIINLLDDKKVCQFAQSDDKKKNLYYNALLFSLFAVERYDDVINKAQKAPETAYILSIIGNSHFFKKDFSSAINYLTEESVLKEYENIPVHIRNIALSFYYLKKFPDAIKYFEKESFKKSSRDYFLLGICYYKIEDYENASRILTEKIDKNEYINDLDYLKTLGTCYFNLCEYTKAIKKQSEKI